jgi:hypothetical protein
MLVNSTDFSECKSSASGATVAHRNCTEGSFDGRIVRNENSADGDKIQLPRRFIECDRLPVGAVFSRLYGWIHTPLWATGS